MSEASDPREGRARLAGAWKTFAVKECRGYSPLYERICESVAQADDVLDLALDAPRPGQQPNVLLAAVHFLLLGGLAHPLGEVYAARSADDPGTLFCDLVRSHRVEIASLLATRRTNTNECGRTAVLVPGLQWVADRLGGPIALLDAGTSAGLNLNLDRYLIDYGDGRTTGPSDASVRVVCEVSGGAPIRSEVPPIVGRVGLDQSPVDLSDEDQARWLLACVWPDTGRLARTEGAIALARQHPHELMEGDMVTDLSRAADRLPVDAPLCVMTSWAVAYLSRSQRSGFVDALEALSTSRPVAWLSAEAPGVVDGLPELPPGKDREGISPSVLGCTVFDHGRREAHVLGRCHPHGSWLDWTDA